VRTWWLGVGEDGAPLFLQAGPGIDIAAEQAKLGGTSWRSVPPVEFYQHLVDHVRSSPEREEAYLEAMEETLEQWERAVGE
jgi:hypothetical protein